MKNKEKELKVLKDTISQLHNSITRLEIILTELSPKDVPKTFPNVPPVRK